MVIEYTKHSKNQNFLNKRIIIINTRRAEWFVIQDA